MKKQKNVKGIMSGIMSANSLTNYPYYKIEGGSMSGSTYLLTYTNVTGTTEGTTNIVSYPTGVTSNATVIREGDALTVTGSTYLLVKLYAGQSATINGYTVQNIGGDFYFNSVKYDIGDSFDYDGLTFVFVGFGSFLLNVFDTDASAVTSITMSPASGAYVKGSTETFIAYDQNNVDITALVALSGDTTTTTYVESWTPTTGALTFNSISAITEDVYFYYVTDETITGKTTITLGDEITSMEGTLDPTGGEYVSGGTEVNIEFVDQDDNVITPFVSLSGGTIASWTASTGVLSIDEAGSETLTFYYVVDESITYDISITGTTS
jgi:hypothetical protein